MQLHQLFVIFVILQLAKNILHVGLCFSDHNRDIRFFYVRLSGSQEILHHILRHFRTCLIPYSVFDTDGTLVDAEFLRPCFIFSSPAIIQIHQVHGSISDIHQKIHALELFQLLRNSGVALGHHRTVHNLRFVSFVFVLKVHELVPEHILAESLPLCLYPFQRKPDCQMDLCLMQPSHLQFLCNRSKCQDISIIIHHFICYKVLMPFGKDIILSLMFQIVLAKCRRGIAHIHRSTEHHMSPLRVTISVITRKNQNSIYLIFTHTIILLIIPVTDRLFVMLTNEIHFLFISSLTTITPNPAYIAVFTYIILHKFISLLSFNSLLNFCILLSFSSFIVPSA